MAWRSFKKGRRGRARAAVFALIAGVGVVVTVSCSVVAGLNEPWHLECDAGTLLCDGVCVPEDVDNCGHCGTECGDHMQCTGGKCEADTCACAPGTTRQIGCGNCNSGSALERCGPDCQWGDAGMCNGATGCTPGDSMQMACGNCQSATSICQPNCEWSDAGACGGPSVCTPGDVQTLSCAMCGSLMQTCSPACMWEGETCTNQGACSPGAMQQVPCGNCGSATETCLDNCTWGPQGACANSGCTPGATACLSAGASPSTDENDEVTCQSCFQSQPDNPLSFAYCTNACQWVVCPGFDSCCGP